MKHFLLLALSLFIAAPAYTIGNEGAHAGQFYALEFVSIGKSIAEELKKPEYATTIEKWNFTAELFEQAVEIVLVREQEKTYLPGYGEVDGINNWKESTIDMNTSRWSKASMYRRVGMVLHEYFGIIEVERGHYLASADFANLISNVTSYWNLIRGQEIGARCEFTYTASDFRTCEERQTQKRNTQAETCAHQQAIQQCEAAGLNNCRIRPYKTNYLESKYEALTCEVVVTIEDFFPKF